MKYSIDCGSGYAPPPPPQKKRVSCVHMNLTLETQEEFTSLREVLGSRHTKGSEFAFFSELADLHNKVVITKEEE